MSYQVPRTKTACYCILNIPGLRIQKDNDKVYANAAKSCNQADNEGYERKGGTRGDESE